MSNEKPLSFRIHIEDIGPYYEQNRINRLIDVNNLHIAVFASNGTGKTFISRLFELSNEKSLLAQEPATSNRLITKGRNSGNFEFTVNNKTLGESYTLNISLARDLKPVIIDDKKFIFHVFNDYYIERNLESCSYFPQIKGMEGYIIGEDAIDISNELDELKETNESINSINRTLQKSLTAVKDELARNGISRNLKEFLNIKLETCFINAIPELPSEANTIKFKDDLRKLINIPDNLVDIPNVDENFNEKKFSEFLDTVSQIVQENIPNFHSSGQMIDYIKNNYQFIKSGIEILQPSTLNSCPFCFKPLDNQSLEIIEQYRRFISGAEANFIDRIHKFIQYLDSFKNSFLNEFEDFVNNIGLFDKNKFYIPSYAEKNIELNFSTKNIQSSFNKLKEILEAKSNNPDKVYLDVIEVCTNIKRDIYMYKNSLFLFNEDIKNLNRLVNNHNEERLLISRSLCNSSLQDFLKENEGTIQQYFIANKKKSDLELSIKMKQEENRKPKKAKVAEYFKKFLDNFFKEKYIYNPVDNTLKFMESNIENEALKVLSDGEKSVVAFCFYLANTYSRIEKQDDLKKLFFIIDDPVSSMDFQYVYNVSQIIKNFAAELNYSGRTRFLVFTHNLEFLSLLKRNGITNQNFYLTKGDLKLIEARYLFPYYHHLDDLVIIALGEKEPSHTTPNSIRHVLETICHFEYPEKDINNFCVENDILNSCPDIRILMQDLSHGALREQPCFVEENLVNSCRTIISFISKNYPGHLEKYSTRLSSLQIS